MMRSWIKNLLPIVLVFIIGGAMLLYLYETGITPKKGTSEEKKYKIGFSIHFMQDDYTVNVVDAFEEALKDQGVETIIKNANGDSKKQVADIEELVRREVDAIGICPLNEAAVRKGLDKAKEKGIKVVTITEIPGLIADAVIYGKEYENGYGSGRRLAEVLKDEKDVEVAVLDFPYDVGRTKERIQGFKMALKGTDIKVVAEGRPSSNEEAMDYIKELLKTHPNIKGIFGSYSNQVIGAGAACKALNRPDIVVVGVDADMLILKLIKEGWVLAVTAQFPREHGRYCAQAILEQLGDGYKSTVYTSPYQIVDQDNAEEIARKLWDKEL